MSTYALKIEHEACWGCRTCEVACKQEHNHKIKFIYVMENWPTKAGDRLDFVYHVNVCQHCDDPPCVDACPEGAIAKRDDGIVILDQELCTGCRSCVQECPYGVIGFDEDDDRSRGIIVAEGGIRVVPQDVMFGQ